MDPTAGLTLKVDAAEVEAAKFASPEYAAVNEITW
jgi:hypothetical protein